MINIDDDDNDEFSERYMCFEERLIDLVREQEFLYNIRSKTYKNVLKRTLAWEEIGKILNRPVGECKQRWKSLRDRFVREKRLMEQPSGCQAAVPDRWEHYDALEFLTSSLTRRRQVGNSHQTATADSSDGLPSPIRPEDQNIDFILGIDDGNETIAPKKVRSSKRMADEDFKNLIEGLNKAATSHCKKTHSASAPVHDVDEEFMLNMAKRMKPLPQAVRMRLHAKLLADINEEVLKLLN